MKVNFYLKDSKASYETLIFCLVSYQNQRVKVYTNKKIHPKYWNAETKKARQTFEGHSTFNKWLKDVDSFVSKIDIDWTNDNSSKNEIPPLPAYILKEKLRKYLSKETKQERESNHKNTFWGYYELFVARMENGTRTHSERGTPLSKGTIFQFHNLKRHLQNFESKAGKISFESIDLVFYKKFIDHLTIKLKLAPNTIGKLITNLKVFLREAFEDGITRNNTFTHRKFKSITSQSDTIYLTIDEIKELQALDLTASLRMDRVRDMFVIGCFTALRYSDLTRIKPEHISEGFIEIKQAKTFNPVVIPVTTDVKRILEKYDSTMPKISNQKYNEYLGLACEKCELLKKEITIKEIRGGKEIFITAPKHKFVSSHTARRSFATNEFKDGTLSVSEIMSLTGHKTERSFYKYIRMTPKENAEKIKEKIDTRDRRIAKENLLKAV